MAAGEGQVLLRYARALHELAAQAGAVAAVERQLDALHEAVVGNAELRLHLSSPQLGRRGKQRLLAGVLGEQAHPLVRRTAMLLVDKGRAAAVGGLGPVFARVAAEAGGRMEARVTSAAPLDDGQRARLVEQLQRLTGKTITLSEAIDPGLLGGVKIVLGSKMIDGSLRRRIETLGNNLLAVPVGHVAAGAAG